MSIASIRFHVLIQIVIQVYPFFGGNSLEVTAVPISNTEVKLLSADGTARAAVWESRTPPNLFKTRNHLMIPGFLVIERLTGKRFCRRVCQPSVLIAVVFIVFTGWSMTFNMA